MAKKKNKCKRTFYIGVLNRLGGDFCPRFTDIVEFEFSPYFFGDDNCRLRCEDVNGVVHTYTLKDDETLFVNFTNLII